MNAHLTNLEYSHKDARSCLLTKLSPQPAIPRSHAIMKTSKPSLLLIEVNFLQKEISFLLLDLNCIIYKYA